MTNLIERNLKTKIQEQPLEKRLYTNKAWELFDALYELSGTISTGQASVAGTGMSLCGTTVDTIIVEHEGIILEKVPPTWLTTGYIIRHS